MASQEALIGLYQGRVAGFVYSFLGRPDQVGDLCQDIFVKMLLSLRQVRNPERFESWLFRIARNRCLDELRRRKWRRIFVPWAAEHEEQAASNPRFPNEEREELLECIHSLPPAQRELLALVLDGDFSYEELAAITGSTVGSVKSRLFRAREELKRRLRHEG